jgi:uncharacterized membrane protein
MKRQYGSAKKAHLMSKNEKPLQETAPKHIEAHKKPRNHMLSRLRGYFFAGVLVTAPISITFYAGWAVIRGVDNFVNGWLPQQLNPQTYLPTLPGLGLVVVVVSLSLIGMLTANFVGRLVIGWGERLLARMPILRGIYSASKQLFETVFSQQSRAFREVVLVEFPRQGAWSVGFVTGDTAPIIKDTIGGPLLSIYVPTAPNPTSGYIIFLPPEAVKPLKITVEEAIKFIVSNGLVPPGGSALPTNAAVPP